MSAESNKNPRVLLAAYHCAEGGGSVSQIGWEWFSRLSEKTPVTLVTHVRNHRAIKNSGVNLRNSDIIFIDTERLAAPLWTLASRLFPTSEHARFMLAQLDYFAYDLMALCAAEKRIAGGAAWDIAHQVTPVSPSAPTRLWKLKIPLVVGPLNGGLQSPKNFPELMRADSAWVYPLKNLGRFLDFFVGSTRNAQTILTATESTVKTLPEKYTNKYRPMIENGVDLKLFEPTEWRNVPNKNQPLKILFVGRLIPAKALPLLLEAVRRFYPEFPVELSIVGDGPMRDEWEKSSSELGLNNIAKFYGNLSLAEIAEKMKDCHVFCLPSVRESGGAVLLEAMAAARPVVAVAYGGPKEIVDWEIGAAIAPDGGSEAVISSLVETFRDVIKHPGAWQTRGHEGRRRAEKLYDWNAKIEQAIEIYDELVERRQANEISKGAEVYKWASD